MEENMASNVGLKSVYRFSDLSGEVQALAGGKGRTLARLYQLGYPVPDGLIILPDAFGGDELLDGAWNQIKVHLGELRRASEDALFAVRSSALNEDSSQASFAGQFDTVLKVHADEDIRKAIGTVKNSRHSGRVKEYSQTHGVPIIHEMAVIVQRLVVAEISGVLFTADPITGDKNRMVGNYVRGLGDRLVSGDSTPVEFSIERFKYKYKGNSEFEKSARRLFRLASRLEKDLNGPQDIEWAIASGKVYILQSRPITSILGFNPVTGEFNDSLTGDFVWSCVNVGEAMSVVMTPFTWSIMSRAYNQMDIVPGYNTIGNIGGRAYQNSNVAMTVLRARRDNVKDIIKELGGVRDEYIDTMDQYLTPLPGISLIKIIPGALKILWKQRKGLQNLSSFISQNPGWCRLQCQRIASIQDGAALAQFAEGEFMPHTLDSFWRTMATAWRYGELVGKLRRELVALVGADEADALLSNVSGQHDLLSSLGPVIGLGRVARGEMSRDKYLEQWGHRGPQETETSIPRAFEDTDWFDKQLKTYLQSPINVETMLINQRNRYNTAWKKFKLRYPRKVSTVEHRLEKTAEAIRLREAVRSELTRLVWVARTWALRAGELLGMGDDVFFLTYDEVLGILAGRDIAKDYLSARRQTYEKYKQLPPYPLVIRGRFDPFRWALDPNRETDAFDSHGLLSSLKVRGQSDNIVLGMPGSAGQIEGTVRRIDNPEHGDELKPGEILVTSQTNIGWTLIFPRAVGIVTDVGAPLSHAAIVARELGIPAVVNCGDATMRLHTGDRVRLDGANGRVEILEKAENTA
jgi:phosphohistidine swiveling domain-containing protein